MTDNVQFLDELERRWEPHKYSGHNGGKDIWRLIYLARQGLALEKAKSWTDRIGSPEDDLVQVAQIKET